MVDMGVINKSGDQIYQYLNFDKIADYKDVADVVELCAALQAFGPGPKRPWSDPGPFSCCASRARWRPRPFRHAGEWAGACGFSSETST